MYICLCHAVTESQIRAAVTAGADSLEEVQEATAAGTDCGQCLDRIVGLLRRAGVEASIFERKGS